MTGPNMSTSRSISNTPLEHVADHNTLHQLANLLDLTTPPLLHDEQVLWLNAQPGMTGNGGANGGGPDCGAAFQAAIDAAAAAGLRLAGKGVYEIGTTTLQIKKSVDLWETTLSYNGTGTAVIVGDDVAGITRQDIRVGRVVAAAKVSAGWSEVAGSVGVKIVDTNKSLIHIKSVTKFETGVWMLGHARGNTYNEIHIGELATNKVNMAFEADGVSGFTNSNKIIGGSWNHDQTESGGTNVSGTRHVLMRSGTGPVADTNTFLGCDFEGDVAEYFVESYGKMNVFRDCRWEASTPKVWWRTGSYGQAIRDGYKPELITVTNDGDRTNVVSWPASGDVAEIVIRPQELLAVVGSPTVSHVVRHPVMNTTNGGTEVLGFTATLPPNWHTYDVEMHMVHDTGGSGTVAWTWRPSFNGTNDTLATPSGSAGTSLTVGAQKVKKTGYIATAQAVTAGKQLTGNVFAGGGTYSGVIGILAVVLRRAS